MTLIEQIRRDRKAGTPGLWDNTGGHGRPTEFGVYAPKRRSICSTGVYSDGQDGTHLENVANAKRCARVPAMEEALLAAVEDWQEASTRIVEQAAEIDRLIGELRQRSHDLDMASMTEQAREIDRLREETAHIHRVEADNKRKYAEIDRLREALEPSGSTKCAYMGEFSFDRDILDENGDEVTEELVVPWTTIKAIMAVISARAALDKETTQ